MPQRPPLSRRTGKPPVEEHSDGPPPDIEDVRRELARRLASIIAQRTGRWRQCPERACRRARDCKLPHGRCAMQRPSRMSAERKAWMLARLREAIERFGEQAKTAPPAVNPAKHDKSDQQSLSNPGAKHATTPLSARRLSSQHVRQSFLARRRP